MPFLPHKHLGRHRCYPESYHSSNFGFDTLTRHSRPLRALCRRAIPISLRDVRGVKDTGSVNLSGLSCANFLSPRSPALVFQWVLRPLRLSERLTQRQGSISLISIRVVRGVKDTGSVNLSGLSCAKVGVILRQPSFPLAPSSGFSMGSSSFTAVRTAYAMTRRHIPVVGSPSRGRRHDHP